MAHKSLRLSSPWSSHEKRTASLEELKKERMALDNCLRRTPNNNTVSKKWGTCQETIGKGTSGIVRVCHKLDEKGERLFAVKELRKKHGEPSKEYIKRLASEYCMASTIQHTNVIQTYDLLPLTETSPVFCQVMEYSGGGDLFDVLVESPDGLEPAEANCFIKQLIHGVAFLHDVGIAHRDLKPENLLLTTSGCLKISDFGSALCFKGTNIESDEEGNEDADEIHLAHGLVGSEPYISPEEFTQETYDARLVDVWSCGIIYLALRKASHPWQVAKIGDDSYEKYLKFRSILDEERENTRRELSIKKNMTEEEKQEERQRREANMLKAKETIRRKAKEAKFDTLEGIDIQAKKIIYRMLDPQPNKRITALEILNTEWFRNIQCCQPS
ncbi:kinase-like domain-containing protein [Sporodiniella umbellata]|nr:kinase-like domain-containing protein [Sporodiniella umbellata]